MRRPSMAIRAWPLSKVSLPPTDTMIEVNFAFNQSVRRCTRHTDGVTDAGGGEFTDFLLQFIPIYYFWRNFQNIRGRMLIACGNSIAYRAVLCFFGRIPGSRGMTSTRYLKPNMEPFGGEAATRDEETFEFEPRFPIET